MTWAGHIYYTIIDVIEFNCSMLVPLACNYHITVRIEHDMHAQCKKSVEYIKMINGVYEHTTTHMNVIS